MALILINVIQDMTLNNIQKNLAVGRTFWIMLLDNAGSTVIFKP